jgi:tetratricopeptide (TPR) repeat protein
MWTQTAKYLLLAVTATGLLTPLGMSGQGQPAAAQAAQPQYKDQGEYTLYAAILAEKDPKAKLAKLQEWQTKYAATNFAKQRKQLFLDTYVKLNQPKEAVATAKEILADDPKDFTSLYYTMFFTRALAGNNPTPDVLDPGEKAATAIVANIDTPPPNVTADQWKGARAGVETLAYSTLGWIAMQRKNWNAAEGEFQKTLQLDPNSGEAEYFMGTVIASEQNPQKMSAALFYFARAASYDGPEALSAAGRQQVLDYVKRAYKGYHGSDEGFGDLMAAVKAGATPPAGYQIKSAADLARELQKKEEADAAFAASHPELTLWKNIKAQLAGEGGAAYFEASMKGAQLPTLKGKVVSLEPEVKPKTVVLALEDGTTPDATLKFTMPLAGKVDPGAELSFEGVPESYTVSPYMVVFTVEPDKLHGWTGKNASRSRAAK